MYEYDKRGAQAQKNVDRFIALGLTLPIDMICHKGKDHVDTCWAYDKEHRYHCTRPKDHVCNVHVAAWYADGTYNEMAIVSIENVANIWGYCSEKSNDVH